MDLTSEQKALRESVADLLRRHPVPGDPVGAPEAVLAGGGSTPRTPAERELWRRLSDIGVAGLAIPERYGGAGAGPLEVHVVTEELGRVLAPSPMLGSAVLAAQAILGSGDEEACERLLPGIGSGAVIAALAWTGRDGGWNPGEAACHAADRGGWTLTGTAHYVLDGDVAHVLIVAATRPDGGIGLFEVNPEQPGVDRQPATPLDQTRRLATVRLAAAAARRLGAAQDRTAGTRALARARDLACLAISAEQVGAATQALELTVSYTKTRIQFGRPIASFQAIQHRLAELHALVESARALSYRAAGVAAGGPGDELPMLVAAAKSYCSEVFATVAAETIQLHGAIGITWEYDAHRYFKRAHGSAQLFGPATAHRSRIATALLDPGSVAD